MKFVKNKIILLLLLLIVLIGTTSIHAQTESMMLIPPDSGRGADPAGLFGQDHYYTVTFRGNGEAAVNLKAIFTNSEEATMSAITLRVPKVEPQDIIAYQVIKEGYCIQYEPVRSAPNDKVVYDIYEPPKCIQYSTPNYYDYYSQNTKYKKADITFEGDTITVHLPQGVSPDASASFILYYRAMGYTTKTFFGSYNYEFETLKTEVPIRTLQVGISADSDMVLKGASSEVNYRFDESVVKLSTDSSFPSAGVANPAIDRYYQQIGTGSIVKSAYSLQPLDSFTVDGSYADSIWQLHGKSILIAAIIILGTLVILGFLSYRIIKMLRHKAATNDNMSKTGTSSRMFTVLWMGGTGFVSSILAAGYTIFLFILFSQIDNYYYFGSQFNLLIALFLLILSIGIYPLILILPPLVIGVKKGLWWGVGTFAIAIGWLLVYLVLIIGFVAVTRMNGSNPRPLPYVYGTQDGVESTQTPVK